MKTIQLRCYVTLEKAVLEGCERYGEVLVPLDEITLRKLSDDDRVLLASILTSTEEGVYVNKQELYLPHANYDERTVLDALTEEIEKARTHRALVEKQNQERNAAWKARLDCVLSEPAEKLIRCFSYAHPPWCLSGEATQLRGVFPEDTALKAKLEEAQALCNKRSAEAWEIIQLREQKADLEKKVAVEEERLRGEEARAAFRAYALDTDELARAALENYDVTTAVLERVVEEIADLPTAQVIVGDTPAWNTWRMKERSAPTTEALNIRDRIVKHVESVRKPTAGLRVGVSRVMRVTMPNDDGDEYRFTGVVVQVESPLTETHAIIFNLEGVW